MCGPGHKCWWRGGRQGDKRTLPSPSVALAAVRKLLSLGSVLAPLWPSSTLLTALLVALEFFLCHTDVMTPLSPPSLLRSASFLSPGREYTPLRCYTDALLSTASTGSFLCATSQGKACVSVVRGALSHAVDAAGQMLTHELGAAEKNV